MRVPGAHELQRLGEELLRPARVRALDPAQAAPAAAHGADAARDAARVRVRPRAGARPRDGVARSA